MTTKIALVGCGNAKNPGVLPAREKYSSNYFSLKRGYGEVVCDDWYILSAKYGLLDPDREIDDYDVSIDDLTDAGKMNWAESICDDLEPVIEEIDEIHLLLGSSYLDPLNEKLKPLVANHDVELVYPFEETSGIGEQMGLLKERTEAARSN